MNVNGQLKLLSMVLLIMVVISSAAYRPHPTYLSKPLSSWLWSGYVVEDNASLQGVSGSWTVPAVTNCQLAHQTMAAVWVGLDGFNNFVVEQTGTVQECVGGKPEYEAVYELFPDYLKVIPMTISGGDLMFGSIWYMSNFTSYGSMYNTFKVTLRDMTQHESFVTLASARWSTPRISAEWILEAPFQPEQGVAYQKLPRSSNVAFMDCHAYINGTEYAINNFPFNYALTLHASTYTTATPTPLNPYGDGFSLTVTP